MGGSIESENICQDRRKQMPKFGVIARREITYEAIVEAEDGIEANEIALLLDEDSVEWKEIDNWFKIEQGSIEELDLE
jgi:hypothetical protein